MSTEITALAGVDVTVGVGVEVTVVAPANTGEEGVDDDGTVGCGEQEHKSSCNSYKLSE